MAEVTNKLQHAIGELHQALESAEGLSPENRALLEQAVSEVRQVLDKAQNPPPGGEVDLGQLPLRKQLAEHAAEFEGDHPTIGGTLRSIVDALAQIGI